ncbi:complex I subunit 5 family protein [Thioalkalivibrio sp. XN279]|uniref:complex I subunit 5 family protein n=1 Tax=Thioalkalivibrio sp. XN279 TaxID=2714953 RepID=UPI00140E12C4|nr:complex I subunit 5 family protein [Thioalkalivibrio sp. XN279]NHA16160.1 NADH dehydrogenase [Thioalkalivibrio sp. XN279]
MNYPALLAAVAVPLVIAAGLVPLRTRKVAVLLAPWAALPALLARPLGARDLGATWMLLDARLGLDVIGATLLPATAALWLAAGLFAAHYIEAGGRRARFFGWFLAAMSGNFVLLAALDAVTFYFGFALMSFASYGLVVHSGTARARHAGRYYIAMVVLGEVCVITGLMMLASQSSTDFGDMRASFTAASGARDHLIIALLVLGFGVKAGVAGLHFWLPLAHPVAPAPASAVLSGAMIKAGLVAWMRFLPLGELALPAWGTGLAALGLFTAYYGVLVGLPQREAKTVLAYSSVSQMGVMTLAVGLGLALPECWPLAQAALLVYIVHHGLVKGTLFLGAGMVHDALPPLLARTAAVVLCLAAWSMAGAPFSGGLAAKLGIKGALPDAGTWHDVVPPMLTLSSLLTGLLLLRFLWVAWPGADGAAGRLPVRVTAAWLALAAAALLVPWWLAAASVRATLMSTAGALHALWPPAVAVALALVAVSAWRRHGRRTLPVVPPGDIGILLERAVLAIGHGLGHAMRERLPRELAQVRALGGAMAGRVLAGAGPLGRAEARLGAWALTALLLLLVAACLAWLFA